MSRRPPDRKTIIAYLLIGLLLVALISVILGGSWFRILRLMLIYGGAFLVALYVFRVMRRGPRR